MSWQELASTSHYRTAFAIAQELAAGNIEQVSEGLGELIEAVARSERRALRSQLIRAMVHALKWREQPEKRSTNWAVSILQARDEIEAIEEEVPTLNRSAIESIWDRSLKSAIRQADTGMRRPVANPNLSWAEVFDDEYRLVPDDPT